MAVTLGELASRFDCELIGDADVAIDSVASLRNATERSLSFLSSTVLKPDLATTRAAAVIVRNADVDDCPAAALVSNDPYATYARMAAVVCPEPALVPGIHATAVVSPDASVADSTQIGPQVVIEDGASVAENCFVGPGCYIGHNCRIGPDCRLVANVSLVQRVVTGARCIVHPGAVIGADGFGNAMTPDGWLKVPQFGGVRIGNDVEIGANSTIDCGALDDTVLEDGVRIDNLVMIAHNVHVGAHTAMAAMTGIAGSAVIGKRCLFAGQSGTVGHIRVCDDVVLSGKGMISKDITEPGVYASAFSAEPVRDWNRKVARVRRLDNLVERVRKLEKGTP